MPATIAPCDWPVRRRRRHAAELITGADRDGSPRRVVGAQPRQASMRQGGTGKLLPCPQLPVPLSAYGVSSASGLEPGVLEEEVAVRIGVQGIADEAEFGERVHPSWCSSGT